MDTIEHVILNTPISWSTNNTLLKLTDMKDLTIVEYNPWTGGGNKYIIMDIEFNNDDELSAYLLSTLNYMLDNNSVSVDNLDLIFDARDEAGNSMFKLL